MFTQIAKIELIKNLKSPAFYIFVLIFLIPTMLFTLTVEPGNYFMGISHGKEHYNAPLLIAQLAVRFGIFGGLFTMMLIGRTVAKDYEARIHEIVFSYPVSKINYLGGRFMGGFIANLLLFLGIFLGIEIGLAFLKDELVGPFRIGSYLIPFILIMIPNTLLIGSIFFRLATISRNMVSTYIAGIAFLGIYGIASAGFSYIESDTIRILIDPFGINGLNVFSRYWTISEMNQNLIPLNPLVLINRIFWTGVAILILINTYRKFQFVAAKESKKEKPIKNGIETSYLEDIAKPVLSLNFNLLFQIKHCYVSSLKASKRLLLHPAFIIITILAVGQIVTNFVGSLGYENASLYPFTSWFLEKTIHLYMYMLPIAILFGGMLIWREKDNKTDEIYNTLPLPAWYSYFNKFFTIMNIQIVFLLLAILYGVFTQAAIMNFPDIELGLYFKHLFGIDFINYLHMIIIVFLIQILSPNKFIGFFLSALYFAADLIIFSLLEFDFVLIRYADIPNFIYSNLNGFGQYSTLIGWYTVYWAVFGAILIMISIGLWRRSVETNLKFRFQNLRSDVTKKQLISFISLVAIFLGISANIYYNRYILNDYITEDYLQQMQADYENKYGQFADMPQPTIEHIDLKTDIYPKKRKVLISGQYLLKNVSDHKIDSIIVNMNEWNVSTVINYEFDQNTELQLHGNEFGFRIYKLSAPLLPGEKLNLSFEYELAPKGFTDNHPMNEIAENGTNLNLTSFSTEYFPVIGYSRGKELSTKKSRKEYNMPPKPALPSVETADRSVKIMNLSRPTYNAVVSTSADQIAITNGELLKEWQENGRNYYHYRSDVKIENEIAILSGQYVTKKEHYNGINIEVYYHERHHYNIDRIINGLKASHDYCTKYFSDFPFKDLRVVEVPDYMTQGTARHFPTLFIWVESGGFITDYEDDELDITFAIAAHENAHHWWAGMVTPAYAEGGYLLTETLAQYVMAMTLEHEFGMKHSRRYIKQEMRRYLARRKNDVEGEKPLVHTNYKQTYLGYKKSTPVMYALQDYMGEDMVGKALSNVVERWGERIDSFPLATDVIEEYRKYCPDSLQYLIDDMFYKITIYENEIEDAVYSQTADGKYKVDLQLKSVKYYADSIGNQTEAPMQDYIYVALMDEDDNEFYYEKHKFDQQQKSLTLITDRIPAKAGLDPFLVLIDRNWYNNSMKVKRLDN